MMGIGQEYMFLAAGAATVGGADKGMLHSHTGLGYLLLVVSLINIALSLSASKNPRTFAKFMRLCHNIYLFGGRANIILGVGMLVMNAGARPATLLGYWWMVASVLLWGGAEVAAKRLVKSDLNEVQDGVPPSRNLLTGFLIEFVILVLIYVCMVYRPAFFTV